MLDAKLLTSMFHVNPNSFTGRLIISTFRETSPWQEPIKFDGLLPLAITSPTLYVQCTGFLTSHKIVMWASGVKQGLRFIVFNRDN